MRIFFLVLVTIIFFSCNYEKGGISNEMKNGLYSFSQESIGYAVVDKDGNAVNHSHFNGEIIENMNNEIITIKFYTEETGCPKFEGGFKLSDRILILYYQDINNQMIKCIDFFELEFKLIDTISYDKIDVVRLNSVKKGFSFKD